MIHVAGHHLEAMIRAAETAYPLECCGLLAGASGAAGRRTVTRVVESDNVHPTGGRDRFEVDPKVRFELMRELGEIGERPAGPERLIGHYHSHPDHPPMPSATDLASAFEPELVWIIIGLKDGRARQVAAHVLDENAGAFRQIPLRGPSGAPYAVAPDDAERNRLS